MSKVCHEKVAVVEASIGKVVASDTSTPRLNSQQQQQHCIFEDLSTKCFLENAYKGEDATINISS